jgi:hypothetical protein
MDKYEQSEFILKYYQSDELKEKPTVDIIKDMTFLDQQIELKQLKITKLKLELQQLKKEIKPMLSQYEELRVEITNRFPNLEKSKEFQKK